VTQTRESLAEARCRPAETFATIPGGESHNLDRSASSTPFNDSQPIAAPTSVGFDFDSIRVVSFVAYESLSSVLLALLPSNGIETSRLKAD
jgi:hypothetical protein